MAQTQTVTDTGIAELMMLWHGTAAGALKSIACMTDDSDVCAATYTDSHTTPADPLCTDSGLSIVDMTGASVVLATSNTAGDSIDFDHLFTASGTKSVSGIVVKNEQDDVVYVSCCFNALLAMESSDTLTIDGRVCINQA